jgi:hypothetical protein
MWRFLFHHVERGGGGDLLIIFGHNTQDTHRHQVEEDPNRVTNEFASARPHHQPLYSTLWGSPLVYTSLLIAISYIFLFLFNNSTLYYKFFFGFRVGSRVSFLVIVSFSSFFFLFLALEKMKRKVCLSPAANDADTLKQNDSTQLYQSTHTHKK